MTIAAVLKQKGGDVVTIAPSATVREIASLISSRRIGAVVVMGDDKQLAGIVSERDLVKALAKDGEAALAMTASDIMTRDVITASPKTTIDEAMAEMDRGYFRHLARSGERRHGRHHQRPRRGPRPHPAPGAGSGQPEIIRPPRRPRRRITVALRGVGCSQPTLRAANRLTTR